MLLAAALLALAPAAPAEAVLISCERGAAEFEARMEAIPQATAMSMRFTLKARERGRRARRVHAPGFDAWTTADPGVTRYVYTRRVEQLIAPARYRVKVRFRWADAAGRTVARARDRTRVCRQRDLRPNLRIVDLTADAGRYVALVRNSGRTDAGAFSVRIGEAEAALDGLRARRQQRVVLAGPCDGEVTAVADPGDAVDERSERDNERTIRCG